ncbi:uncharacterized protein LOC113003313 isoform X2 [Solenopsis invicta]|uniref:uncharacterized protein LOC113003313 isoform X2 n=1 Tax=Solenopsis invicta TaxID=13686 RepID=UPI00193E782F|nr:uncharacterized protein LOC113003313 isoform X2 [Solenopsis invicta]
MFRSLRKLISSERYYNIYRIMLTAFGLWPYQTSSVMKLQAIFFLGAYCFILVFQCTIFLTATCNLEFIIKELSYIFITVLYIVSYNSYYFNSNGVKYLLEQIKLDWNTMEDNSEIRILEKYAFEICFRSLILGFFVICCIFSVIFIELIPVILDAVAPMNESRPRKIKMDFEFFIDEQKYFYIYLIYEIIVILLGIFTILATGTLSMAFLQHCCATIKIASNLIKNIVTKHTLETPAHRRTHVMYRNINRAVHIHRKSLQFSTFLMKIMNKWYFFIIIFSVMSLTCNLFRLLNALKTLKELSEVLMSIGLILGHFIIIFVPNLVGQSLTDHSAEIFNAAYSTMWYLAPLSIQKLLLFVMQNSLKSHVLTIGRIYISSLEGFSTIVLMN